MKKLYKAFNVNNDGKLQCMKKTYEPGVVHEEDESKIRICGFGMHACPKPWDCYTYYTTNCPIWEVRGKVVDKGDDKVVCSKLKLVKPIDWSEAPRPNKEDAKTIVRRLPWDKIKVIMLKHKVKSLWQAVVNTYLWEVIADPDIQGIEKYLPTPHNFDFRSIRRDHKRDVLTWLLDKKQVKLAAIIIDTDYSISLSIEEWNKVNEFLDNNAYANVCPPKCRIDAYKRRRISELLKKIVKSPGSIEDAHKQLAKELKRHDIRAEWLKSHDDYKYALEHSLINMATVSLSEFFIYTTFSDKQMKDVCQHAITGYLDNIILHPNFTEEHAEFVMDAHKLRTVKLGYSDDFHAVRAINLIISKFPKIADARIKSFLRDKYMTKEVLSILTSPDIDKVLVRRHLRYAGTKKWFKEQFPDKYEEYQQKGWIK